MSQIPLTEKLDSHQSVMMVEYWKLKPNRRQFGQTPVLPQHRDARQVFNHTGSMSPLKYSQMPRAAHWPGQHLIGSCIVNELFTFGVPFQFSAG